MGCLIESVSKVSNVAGVYSAYLHIWDPRALKRMEYVKIESAAPFAGNNRYFELNANDLIDRISGDVLYLDPPYTSTQYISQYHVLETINRIVYDLLKYLSAANAAELYKKIVSCIKKYGLSKGNKAAYAKLRTDYNSKNISERDPLLLYLLICYGFEHQIRFNTRLEFNNPCGNSGFNDEMYEKLITFNRRCKNLNIIFKSGDYQAYVDQLNSGDFVYCDPPYLSTCGVYTDGRIGFNGWDKNQQRDLTVFLEKLHDKNIRFMLSNYTEHSDGDNDELLRWAKANNFKIIYNDKLTKRNRRDRRELIIINY